MIEEYLRELRASLRTRRDETERIIAEAEDHLAQSVAAGRAAGLSEVEAQEAAVSAFGSVSAVVRAHTTHRVRLRVLAADLLMVAWKLAWLSLLAFGVVQLPIAATLGEIGLSHAHVVSAAPGQALKPLPMPPSLPVSWEAGSMLLLGLVLAVGYRLARSRRPAPLGGFFPLVATVFFVVATPVGLAAASANGNNGIVHVQINACVLAMAGLAAVYCARMAGTLIWQRTPIWQRRAS